jgi:hypothetical protein
MAESNGAASVDSSGYPQSPVAPILTNEKTACNPELPGGDVIEWFDFGQFVELLAVDAAGISHPVVLANQEELARATGGLGQGADLPLRMVDVVGGIPLSEIADEDLGQGERALAPLADAREILVEDVDKLIAAGEIVVGASTYRVTLTEDEARRLADGEQIVHPGRLVDGTSTRDVIVRLAPIVDEVDASDIETLLAERKIVIRDVELTLTLEPAEVTALLGGHTVIVRAKAAGRTRLLRLKQSAAAPEAAAPANTESSVTDLAAFLANPVVPGAGGKPFTVPLDKPAVHALRTAGTAAITLSDGSVMTITVAKPGAARAESVMMMRRRDDEGGEFDPEPDPPEQQPTEEPPAATPIESTVTVITAESPDAKKRLGDVMKTSSGGAVIKKWLEGLEPLPARLPPPPPRPPFHLRVALFLPWRQTWTMKGLSRGRLLQSLSLAPQEETTIELQTWERHRKTLEQSSQTDSEQTIEGTDTTKDTSEVYNEVQRQSDFQYQVGGSLKATYRPAAGEIEIGANAQLSGKTAVNQVGKNTQTRLHEAVIKASTKVRSQRTTKITETVEWGSEQKVTRKIRNPNLCHTLNLDYYEVLAHYDVTTSFMAEETKLCAMVQNPITIPPPGFKEEIVLVNETALRDALLDRALADGFEAIRLLGAYAEAKQELMDRRAAAAMAAKVGAQEEKKEVASVAPAPTRQETAVLEALKALQLSAAVFAEPVSAEGVLNAIARHETVGDTMKRQARRWMYTKLVDAKFPNFASTLRSLAADKLDADAEDKAAAAAEDKPTATAKIVASRLETARRIAATIPAPTSAPTLASLNDLTDTDKESAGLASAIQSHMAAAWDWAWWSGRCREEQLYTADDMGVAAAAKRLVDTQMALDATPSVVDTATKEGAAMVDAADQKQDQRAGEDTLEMKFALEDVARARERKNTLLSHLNEHLDYYRFVLFQALPPSEQLERLMSGSGGALRVGMFEPRVVSMHGPLLAVPLHSASEEVIAKFRMTIVASLSTIKTASSRLMLPTPGMSIESRLGRCSACEDFIESTREIELRRLSAAAKQTELEAARMEARLAAKQLSDPKPAASALGVRIDNGVAPVSSTPSLP